MSRLETPATTSSYFAHTDNLVTALNASATQSNDPWVIDFSASNHMAGMSSLFSSYNPCSNKEKVRIAYGFLCRQCLTKALFLSHPI
jgi:hypothetical protein